MSDDIPLKAEVRLDGAELAAAQARALDDELRRILNSEGEAADLHKEFADLQSSINAGQRDWLGLLRQIHPQLGNFASTLFNASKVAGSLAEKDLDLVAGLEALTGALGKNMAALKLFGAIGFALFGVNQLISAIQRLKKEEEDVAAAMQKETEALDAVDRKRQSSAQSLEKLAEERRGGGYRTPEELAAAESRLERLMLLVPQFDRETAMRAVTLAGPEMGMGELIHITALMQTQRLKLDQDVRQEAVAERFARASARPESREFLDRFDELLTKQEQQLAARATEQAQGLQPGTLAIEKMLERAGWEAGGADINKMGGMIKRLPEVQEGDRGFWRTLFLSAAGPEGYIGSYETGRPATVEEKAARLGLKEHEVQIAEIAAQQIANAVAKELGPVARELRDAAEKFDKQPVAVHNYTGYWSEQAAATARRNGEARIMGSSRP